jgi:hypothetical protein
MTQSGDLASLRRCGTKRALRLRSLVEKYRPPIENVDDRTIAFVAIEALNLWATFVRSFYLSCVHNARRESGSRVMVSVTGLQSDAAAIAFSVSVIKVARRGEPIWHDPGTLSKLLRAVGASNLTQVQAAISSQPYVFKALPTVRNFFAHRSLITAQKVWRCEDYRPECSAATFRVSVLDAAGPTAKCLGRLDR